MTPDRDNLYRLSGAVLFLLLWEVIGRSSLGSTFLPPFSDTAITMFKMIWSGEMITHSIATLTRVYTGFLIASVLGISSGLLIGWSRKAEKFLDVLIDFLRHVSSITLIPITLLLIGIGFTQKVTVLVYATFFPILLNTMNGVNSTDKSLIDAARSMGATDWQIMKEVVFYSALPSIFTGLRLGMGVSFVVVVAAELVGSTSGLGYLLQETSRTYHVTQMFATALWVSILGYISSKMIIIVERETITWRD